MTAGLPDFATNYGPDGLRVADEVNRLFKIQRENLATPPPLAIVTAYINPGGFILLADELEQAPRVRLLLGAEPDEETVRALTPPASADQDERRHEAVTTHEAWLKSERDTMGFERESTQAAQRMVEWLRSMTDDGGARVEVRRYTQGFLHGKAYIVDHTIFDAAIAGSSNMTYAGLAHNAELNLGTLASTPAAHKVIDWFNARWDQSDSYDLAALYAGQWAPHSPWEVFLRMLWELYAEHLDEEKTPARTFGRLTRFQSDGVTRMRRLLDELGGVLVADEVGLGKTFLAGEVIHEANEVNRQRVLVIAPAALVKSMWEPFLTKHGFSRLTQVYSYEQVRDRMDPAHAEHASFRAEVQDFALVVVDEAHNLRNAGAARSQAVDRVILDGVHPKKVVLLTATPVNNSLTDLEVLIRYFVRDDAHFASVGIPSIRQYIRNAQALNPQDLTPAHLFDLMDQVAVRRTRKFVKEHYPNEQIIGPDGQPQFIRFPAPKVRRIDYDLDGAGLNLVDSMIYALDPPEPTDPPDPLKLTLARYTPSAYLLTGQALGYQVSNAGLLRSALLKRLESSPQALKSTLETLIAAHETFLDSLSKGWVLIGDALREWGSSESDDLDQYVADLDLDRRDQAERADQYRTDALAAAVGADLELLQHLHALTDTAIHDTEPKVQTLLAELERIARAAQRPDKDGISSGDRRKVLVFSTYSDTIVAVHEEVQKAINLASVDSPLAAYKGRLAPPIMGAYKSIHKRGESGGVDQGGRAATVEGFAPKTASRLRDDGTPTAKDEFDLLLTTDVLAEGVNLQQAGHIINFDLPWNPMRIVQRHGRIDRIGSHFKEVQLGVFFPAERLDAMLGLETRLVEKLAQAAAAVGTGHVLPGQAASPDVILADPDEAVEQIEELVKLGGSSAALSGEEYRRRLFNSTQQDPLLSAAFKNLPYGSGSGFENPRVDGNGYVFCVKVADHPQPWFRYVRCDEEWRVEVTEDLEPAVFTDTLASLIAADPGTKDIDRWMTDEVYDKAFDAWAVARESAWEAWELLTDPLNLQPDVPKAFRDAADLVLRAGGFLGPEEQTELRLRLGAVPSAKVAREVRGALNDGNTNEQQITLVKAVLDEYGIQVPPPPEPLPYVNLEEVRLVAWMAVKGKPSVT
ncbi:SNF2-related protein [Mycobacterium sp. NPDC049093]